jgi:hypothetical protein
MPPLAIGLLGVAALLQFYFVTCFMKPWLRAGWRGRVAEVLFWMSIATSAVGVAIGGRL